MSEKSLRVMLWGREVGRLLAEPPRFEFSSEWKELNPLDVAGAKLPALLADALPDAWGNRLFELAGKSSVMDKLAFIGRHSMGALEFVPEEEVPPVEEPLDVKALTALAKNIYEGRTPEESPCWQTLLQVGTSAGGQQPKAIVAVSKATGAIYGGRVPHPEDYDHCLLKFNVHGRSTAELEMAYHEMALLSGIAMMPCRLIEVEGVRHFLTRRFDRTANGKLHAMTLAALYPEAHSYEQLFTTCQRLHLSEADLEEAFRRMAFNLLANNSDDHHKNFSFLLHPQGQWRLAPAYDLTFIFSNKGKLPDPVHSLTIRGRRCGILREHVLSLARAHGIARAEEIMAQVAQAVAQFRPIAERHSAAEPQVSAIERAIGVNRSLWGLD